MMSCFLLGLLMTSVSEATQAGDMLAREGDAGVFAGEYGSYDDKRGIRANHRRLQNEGNSGSAENEAIGLLISTIILASLFCTLVLANLACFLMKRRGTNAKGGEGWGHTGNVPTSILIPSKPAGRGAAKEEATDVEAPAPNQEGTAQRTSFTRTRTRSESRSLYRQTSDLQWSPKSLNMHENELKQAMATLVNTCVLDPIIPADSDPDEPTGYPTPYPTTIVDSTLTSDASAVSAAYVEPLRTMELSSYSDLEEDDNKADSQDPEAIAFRYAQTT